MTSVKVPSKCGKVFAELANLIPLQRLYRPFLQYLQVLQYTPTSRATLSPTWRVHPAGKVSGREVMIPEASWPRTIGAWILNIPLAPCE